MTRFMRLLSLESEDDKDDSMSWREMSFLRSRYIRCCRDVSSQGTSFSICARPGCVSIEGRSSKGEKEDEGEIKLKRAKQQQQQE
jgi:hypothetical protein